MSDQGHRKLKRARDSGQCIHALTFSTHRRQPVLIRPGIPEVFFRHLDEARREQDFELFAFVLMPEHVHLAIGPRSPGFQLSKALRAIKLPSAREVFSIHPELAGALNVTLANGKCQPRLWLAGGGYDCQMELPDSIRSWIAYVHGNPVRRGLVQDIRHWRWSSAAEPPPIDVDPFAPWG